MDFNKINLEMENNLNILKEVNNRKFAKLFDLPCGNQVVFINNYNNDEECYQIEVISCIDGTYCKFRTSFFTKEHSVMAFHKISLNNAKDLRNLLEWLHNIKGTALGGS